MAIIIGIDPGSRQTGYGVIECINNQSRYLASGCLRVATLATAERMQQIHAGIQEIILQFQPVEAAIEQIFMHQNPNAAIKLGQARGAALVALAMPVAEYSARQVKQSVVGYGAASKDQVQHMVQKLLNLSESPQADAADALAIALCHAHVRTLPVSFKRTKQRRSTSWRQVKL